MPAAAGFEEVTEAGDDPVHVGDLICWLTASIGTPGIKDVIGIQLRQAFCTDIDAAPVRDAVDQRREPEPGIAQHPAQRVIAVMHGNFAVVSLDNRHADVLRVDDVLQLRDLLLIAAFEDRQLRLGAGELRQLAVDARRPANQMIDADGRRDFLQLLYRHVAARFGDNQVRFGGGNRFDIHVSAADKLDSGVIKIDPGQQPAGAQEVATVRARSAVAGHRRRAKLDQRNRDIKIVQ